MINLRAALCFLWCADAFVTLPQHNALIKTTALHMSLYERDVTTSNPPMIAGNKPDSISEKSSSEPMTVITKNIKAADPIPEAGIDEAVELMRTGKLYRYNVPDASSSVVSQVEVEVAAYTGHKYCVALNSCGSALFLALKCAGVQAGDKVLTNAFTFAAVPSAIEHAGGVATYVETDWNFCIDVSDLETKLNQHPDAKFLMVSHMRGKIADMDAIVKLCEDRGVYLLEDCAHSIGVLWNGKHTGHHGQVCGISSQSYKMLNSGEGGFLLTNDDDVGAKAAVYAGAYESLHSKHTTVPPAKVFTDADMSNELPNYSLRMHAVTAAIIRPQINTIDERREQYNARYYKLADQLNALNPGKIQVPTQRSEVTIVGDSLQLSLPGASKDQLSKIVAGCAKRGLPVELFGHPSNARFFKNWKFAPALDALPQTEAVISCTLDVRMPLSWEEKDFEDMYSVLKEAIADAGLL